MFYRPLQQVPSKTAKLYVNLGRGINNGYPPFDIPSEYSTDEKNLDSRKYPVMHVRNPRSSYTDDLSGTIYSFSKSDTYLTVVDGTAWKYWSGSAWTSIDTMTVSANASQVNFGDYTVITNGTDQFYWDGATTTGTVATMPDLHRLTVHANRIYGCATDDNLLYYSALGKYNDWTTASDAGDITIETEDGEFGVTVHTYADHVIYFKEHSMHELYGTGPTNFSMQQVSDRIGCVAARSVKEVQGYLFWLGEEGVYMYGGGTVPQKISYPYIEEYIDSIDWTHVADACAGTDGTRYYLCLPINSDARVVLTYDITTNSWHVEDTQEFVEFVEFDGDLYGMQADGQAKLMDGTAGESIAWYWISKRFDNKNISNKQTVRNIYVTIEVPSGTTAKCAISKEDGSYTDIKTFSTSANPQVVEINLPTATVYDASWYTIKFYGTGPCTIHKFEVQSRIRRDAYLNG